MVRHDCPPLPWWRLRVRKVAATQDPLLKPLPVIGNGDILSWRDHEERLEQAKELGEQEGEGRRWSTCCMLAR